MNDVVIYTAKDRVAATMDILRCRVAAHNTRIATSKPISLELFDTLVPWINSMPQKSVATRIVKNANGTVSVRFTLREV